MNKKQVELLAPAGSYESMTAAFKAGADAVYIGGSRFGARAYADNPGEELLLKAIDYAHLHSRRLYMTVNTLVKEEELGELSDFLHPYYVRGVDAVIVQDMGVFLYIRERFPDLPIHVSTQMTVTGSYGAKLLEALGAQRIVTARELSLGEIRRIRRESGVEIESFVHGALCYSYSGQCLFSSIVGGRSGNRGRCAQPCRLPYDVEKDGKQLTKGNNRYVLSLKDLCTLDLLPELLEAGVFSLKIEGRMKGPRYTAGVVSIYRKYVDMYLEHGKEGYLVDETDKKLLLDLFNRGGFTEGYSRQHNGKDMLALREKPAFREGNQILFSYLDKNYIQAKQQEKICGKAILASGVPSVLELATEEVCVKVFGEAPQNAHNQPMSSERVRKQLLKTGNSPFVFQSLEIELQDGVFLPVQALNELRRQGLEALETAVLDQYRRENTGGSKGDFDREERGELPPGEKLQKAVLAVSLEEERQLLPALAQPEAGQIYLDATGFAAEDWKRCADQCHQAGKDCLLVLPHIFRTEAREYFSAGIDKLKAAGFDGLVLRSLEEAGFLKEYDVGLPLVFDYGMYTMNHMAVKAMRQLGASRITLPVELNSREMGKLSRGAELIVYGHIPMMVTAQCIQKTMEGCRKVPVIMRLRDRLGKEFPVKNHCRFCYNTIYNSSPISLLGNEAVVEKLAPSVLRLQFTLETPEEVQRTIRAFADAFVHGRTDVPQIENFTRGHFKRGIE